MSASLTRIHVLVHLDGEILDHRLDHAKVALYLVDHIGISEISQVDIDPLSLFLYRIGKPSLAPVLCAQELAVELADDVGHPSGDLIENLRGRFRVNDEYRLVLASPMLG